jgi:hypothetical protein
VLDEEEESSCHRTRSHKSSTLPVALRTCSCCALENFHNLQLPLSLCSLPCCSKHSLGTETTTSGAQDCLLKMVRKEGNLQEKKKKANSNMGEKD